MFCVRLHRHRHPNHKCLVLRENADGGYVKRILPSSYYLLVYLYVHCRFTSALLVRSSLVSR